MHQHKGLLTFIWALTVHVAGAPAATQTFTIGPTGELLSHPPRLTLRDTFQIRIGKPVNADNPSLWLAYRYADEILQPSGAVDWTDKFVVFNCEKDEAYCTAQSSPDLKPTQAQMLLYTVFGRWNTSTPPPDIEKLEAALSLAEKNLKSTDDRISSTNRQISDLTDQIKQFQGMSTADAASAVRILQGRIEALRNELAEEKAKRSNDQGTVDKAARERDEGRQNSCRVLRAGASIIGEHRKVINYRLVRDANPAMPVRLERLGDYPELRQDDEIWIDITNVRKGTPPEWFDVTANQTVESPPNIAPVRPSSEWKALTEEKKEICKPIVYNPSVDVIQILGVRPKPNGVIKLTISAYLTTEVSNKVTTADDQPKSERVLQIGMVKLIDGVELPQIHALYPYNIATGILVSFLRDPTFSKNRTKAAVLDDAGKVKAPAEYEVVTDKGEPRPMPTLFFTWYIKPFDAQRKWAAGDLIPRPSLGFSLTSPAENVFIGGASEITRNVQLVAGWHYGKVTYRGPIPVDETTTDTAPATVKRFSSGAYIGLTFNISFIKSLFEK
jgi:hypothetical protein